MSAIGIPDRTLRDVLYNDLLGLTHFFSAGAVAAVVNYVAHKVFQAKKYSGLSTTLTLTSLAVGFAVSLSVCPTATVISFAGMHALKWLAVMLALGYLIGSASELLFRRTFVLPFGGGSLVGYIPALLYLGGFGGAAKGAGIGAKVAHGESLAKLLF